MRNLLLAAVAAIALAGAAQADTIKIGVVGPFSGPFALQGKNFKAGIDAYMALNGTTVGDDDIEIIYRDMPHGRSRAVEGAGAGTGRQGRRAVSRRLLFHARCHGGHAAARAGQHAAGHHECRDFGDRDQEPARRAHLVHDWQTLRRRWPRSRSSAASRRSITVVSDYGPGVDAENAFKTTFEDGGGRSSSRSACRCRPTISARSCSACKDSGAEAVFAFLPSGPTTLGFVKAYNENGAEGGRHPVLAPGDLTQESDLPALGDAALGMPDHLPLRGLARLPGEQGLRRGGHARRSAIRPNSPSRRSAPMTACM